MLNFMGLVPNSELNIMYLLRAGESSELRSFSSDADILRGQVTDHNVEVQYNEYPVATTGLFSH
jgi:hypothetical protein